MAGRKPKPIELKRIEGNPGKRPLPEEIKPSIGETTCPTHLSETAKKEWIRIVPELLNLGLLTNIDRAALAAYCQAFGRWVDAENVINEKGVLYKTAAGNVITSPMLWVANKAMEQMHKFLTEFGLTPSSRARIAGGNSPPKPSDPFEGLLKYCNDSTKSDV